MLDKLFKTVADALTADDGEATGDRAHGIQLASAALMVEVARADHDYDPEEFSKLLSLIESHFDLTGEEAASISNIAEERVEHSVSLHEFTRVLHESLDVAEKSRVVGMLWRVAYADGRLDMYEDALVLKISDLLYVPRTEVMRLKHLAAQDLPGQA